MTITAVASPVPAAKVAAYQQFRAALDGTRRAEFEASRRRVGLREYSFAQPLPDGSYLQISVWEGDDPAASLRRMLQAQDEFTRWFVDQVKEIHGVDPDQVDVAALLPQQPIDSGPI